MGVDEIQPQECKLSRTGNSGRIDSTKMSLKDQYPDDEEDGDQRHHHHHQLQLIDRTGANNDASIALAGTGNRLRGWQHSSRIIRVSRASGGKDRHSKVWTSKGLRDRRVRLSVTTAIQFYDLQDRLGYDQPSKAVEWLIKAAADSIAELPSLSDTFPDTPKQLSDEKRASEGTDQQGVDYVDQLDVDPNSCRNYQQNQSQQNRSFSKSACSSNSETSKGSSLSLSRSELRVNRVKARERARERAAKDKDQKENESQMNPNQHGHHHNVNPINSQSSSFTELLTGGGGNNNNNSSSPTGSSQQANEEQSFFHKAAARPWPATPMDYFNSGLLGPPSSRPPPHHFSGQIQLGSSNLPQAMAIPAPFSLTNESHQEMQHFSFVNPDHLIPVTAIQQQPGPGGGDYNLNFTISSGLAGFNRGTLQSNSSSPSLLPHLQRFGSNSLVDGSNLNVPFFIGTTPTFENHQNQHHHHPFPAGLDGRLQLYYGDGNRHYDQKGKGKN